MIEPIHRSSEKKVFTGEERQEIDNHAAAPKPVPSAQKHQCILTRGSVARRSLPRCRKGGYRLRLPPTSFPLLQGHLASTPAVKGKRSDRTAER